jgi:formylglycine-generating enzyme required for sulfatase activity
MRRSGRLGIAIVALATFLWAAARVGADGLMLIAAGPFWMGRDDGAPNAAPLHRVYVGDFWIERHKVTNAEFAAFLTSRGPGSTEGHRRFDHDDADARIHLVPAVEQHAAWAADRGYENHPVVEVSWFGARDYCAWQGRRLPTEAEWEKAARGQDRRRYPWGDAPPTGAHAVFGSAYNATAPTDGRPAGASPYGVHDLLGNLREWTATMLKPYPYRHDDGREPFTGAGRVVVRGASHDDPVEALSVTLRRSYDRRGASAGHHDVGFRCATSDDLGEVAPGGRR